MIEKLKYTDRDIQSSHGVETIKLGVSPLEMQDKINELIDYINPKEIEEKETKNYHKENKIPCGHKNCPRANNGLTYCVQTNDRIREEWREELKPKITIFNEEDKDRKDVALAILNEYWDKLEPKIAELLKSQREQRTKEIMEMIEKIDVSGGGNGRRLKQQILDELK